MTSMILALAFPITSGAGPHITITYADASTADVTLSSGTYHNPNTTGPGLSLLAEIATECTAADTKGHTWTASNDGGGVESVRSVLTAAGGSSAVTKITFLTTEVTSTTLGFTTTPGAPDDVTFTASSVTGLYQRQYVWRPDRPACDVKPRRRDWVTGAASGTSTTHVMHHYGGIRERIIRTRQVEGALIWTAYRERAGFAARVDDLSVSDPHAALTDFLDDFIDLIDSDKATASIYMWYTQDESSSYDLEFKWVDTGAIGTWAFVQPSNDSSPLYTVEMTLRVV